VLRGLLGTLQITLPPQVQAARSSIRRTPQSPQRSRQTEDRSGLGDVGPIPVVQNQGIPIPIPIPTPIVPRLPGHPRIFRGLSRQALCAIVTAPDT
jgi:hypothetical protein